MVELKVSGTLLIAPEFCTHLSDETKRKSLNEEGMEYQNDSTSGQSEEPSSNLLRLT